MQQLFALLRSHLFLVGGRHHLRLDVFPDRIPQLDIAEMGLEGLVFIQGEVALLRPLRVAIVAIVLQHGEDLLFEIQRRFRSRSGPGEAPCGADGQGGGQKSSGKRNDGSDVKGSHGRSNP
jgi:hypothetical protein